MCVLTEDDEGSYYGDKGNINEGGSEIVVVEMGSEIFQGERGGGNGWEKSRRKECIGNNKENRGREKKKRYNHGDQEEQSLEAPHYSLGFVFFWGETHGGSCDLVVFPTHGGWELVICGFVAERKSLWCVCCCCVVMTRGTREKGLIKRAKWRKVQAKVTKLTGLVHYLSDDKC